MECLTDVLIQRLAQLLVLGSNLLTLSCWRQEIRSVQNLQESSRPDYPRINYNYNNVGTMPISQ